MSTNNANANGQKLDCPIVVNGTILEKDGKPVSLQIDCSNVSGSIGRILETMEAGTEFRALGATVKIPKGSFSAQFNAIVSALIAAAFVGCEPTDQPKDKNALALVVGLNGKLHFKAPTCEQVKEALKIRKSNYSNGVQWERNKVRMIEENKVLIAQTNVLRIVNKAAKEGGRPAVEKAIADLTKPQVKLIGNF